MTKSRNRDAVVFDKPTIVPHDSYVFDQWRLFENSDVILGGFTVMSVCTEDDSAD